jgi:ADP-heptose:LPS heptosyltransferase
MKKRLLVVDLHHLGDAVLSLPFVRGAQEHYEVHVLCRPATRAIYELLATPPKIHAWEPPWADDRPCSARQVLSAARDRGRILRPLEFDTAVCAWADARIEILLAETRARHRVGFSMSRGNYYAAGLPWRRERRWFGRIVEIGWPLLHPRRPLLTRPLHRQSPGQSHLHCWEQIAAACGTTFDTSIPWLEIPAAATSSMTRRPLLAIHARARLPTKQWPLERWKELLAAPPLRERFDLLEIIPPGATRVSPESACHLVTDHISALAGALAGADAVVCHDSLPAHLAAALGKPVITIFGSGEPAWFAPWNNRDRVVQSRVCPLHPCIDRCGMDHYLCLDAVSVADVLRQIENLPLRV